jgi:hypothetical protein
MKNLNINSAHFRRRADALWRGLVSLVSLFLPFRFGGNPKGFDVSLTTHGSRILLVGVSIASFCLGTQAVRNVYLRIDQEEKLTLLKRLALIGLRLKGVQVLRGPRRGPHGKYWQYLHSIWDGETPFMLIDDDVVYPSDTAALLFLGAKTYPTNVCLRSFWFGCDLKGASLYKRWEMCKTQSTSHAIFATNVGGIVVQPKFAHRLITLGEAYRDFCGSVDDVWFHWVAVHYDLPYTQLVRDFRNPPTIPRSQNSGLHMTVNVHGNDEAISKQYGKSDYKIIEKALYTKTDEGR